MSVRIGIAVAVAFLFLATIGISQAAASGPLRVDPANPRYFTDDSGAVIFLAGAHASDDMVDFYPTSPITPFDWDGYMSFLSSRGYNLIRLWAWEQERWAPWATDQFFDPSPYARSSTCCTNAGTNKFDLNTFNQAYFDRLLSRVQDAASHGIYVIVELFQGWSIQTKTGQPGNPWPGHPYNSANNINGINGDPTGTGDGTAVHTLGDSSITNLQKAYIDKVVQTLAGQDNVLYEISNEDTASTADTAWQNAMIDYVHQEDNWHHMVGMSYQYPGGSNTDLLNSHADWISPNSPFNPDVATGSKVIIADSDHGAAGSADGTWVWEQFTQGANPLVLDDGCCSPYQDSPPTSTENSFRGALTAVKNFAAGIPLDEMTPQGSLSSTGYALACPGKTYVAFQPSSGSFTLDLSAASGTLNIEWFDPTSGAMVGTGTVSGGAVQTLMPPASGAIVALVSNQVLVPNPNFETGSLSPWTVHAGSGSVVTGQAHTGTYAVQVTGDGSWVQEDLTGVTPGQTYTLHGYGEVVGGGTVQIGAYDGTTEWDSAVINSTSYTALSTQFTPASSTVDIFCYRTGLSGSSDCDDFYVTVASPTPVLPNAGFESGSLSPWTVGAGSGSVVSGQAHWGTYAAQITGDGSFIQYSVRLTAGQTYTLHGFGKIVTGGTVQIGAFDGTTEWDSTVSSSTSYTALSTQFTPASSTVNIFCYRTGSTGSSYCDDLYITSG